MNIFYLDENPINAAIYQVNKHIVKMPLETCQMLTVNLQNIYNYEIPFENWKKTKAFLNHPCAIWARTSRKNYEWLCLHGLALCEEYTYRYEKIHSCQKIIQYCLNNTINLFPNTDFTGFAARKPLPLVRQRQAAKRAIVGSETAACPLG